MRASASGCARTRRGPAGGTRPDADGKGCSGRGPWGAHECWGALSAAPRRLAMPDYPEATSPALTEHYHTRAEHIASIISLMTGRESYVVPFTYKKINE